MGQLILFRPRGVDAGAREWRSMTRIGDPESVSDLPPLGAAVALAVKIRRRRVPPLRDAQGLHTITAFGVSDSSCKRLAVARDDLANAVKPLDAVANFPAIRRKLTVFPLAMASVLDTVV